MAGLSLEIVVLFLDNKMTTLKQFLVEYATKSRSKTMNLTTKQIIQWIEKNSPNYIKHARITPIFRGSRNKQLMSLISPQNFTRKSANTSNIYTTLIDNSPNWKEYPKRSKSLICSTASEGYIEQYGDIHFVIPEDKAMVGICPASDFWESFSVLKSFNISDMDEFNVSIIRMLDSVNLPCADKSLITSMKKFNELYAQKILKNDSEFDYDEFLIELAKRIEFGTYKNLYEAVEVFLDPKTNKFKHTVAADFNDKTGNKVIDYLEGKEVWVSGKCMLINLRLASEKKDTSAYDALLYLKLNNIIL